MNKPPRIDPEFKSLIPPLSPEEYHQLEQNILTHQCRDPITLWRNIIIDGHNRYEICTKHGLSYETKVLRFPSREAVKLWMLENQLGRRNLSDAMRIELAARKVQCTGQKTYINKAIAKEAGLNEKMVQRYMHIKSKGGPELVEKVMSGRMKIGTAHRQLEVITTTREELEIEPLPPEEQNVYILNGIMGNIEKITGLYRFVIRHSSYSRHMADDVYSRFDSRYKRLGKLVKGLE